MVTVFVIWKDPKEDLAKTITSVFRGIVAEQAKAVVISSKACSQERKNEAGKDGWKKITWLEPEGEGTEQELWTALQEQMKQVKTSFVSFVRAGEEFHGDSLRELCEGLKRNEADADCAAPVIRKQKKKYDKKAQEVLLDLNKFPELGKAPGCLEGLVFSADAIKGECFDFSYGSGFSEEFKYRILLKKAKLVYVKNALFSTASEFLEDNGFCAQWKEADWYLSTAEDFCMKMLRKYRDAAGNIPLLIQAQILYILNMQFYQNLNNRDKKALNEQQRQQYFQMCRICLQQVDDTLLLNQKKVHVDRELTVYCRALFLELKYEDRKEQCDRGKRVFPVTVHLTEFEKNSWKLDWAVEPFLLEGNGRFCVLLNGKEVSFDRSSRFSSIRFFGAAFEKPAFHLEIPIKAFSKKNLLEFCLKDGDKTEILPVISSRYQSRISSLVRGSYWCFGPYMTLFKGEKTEKEGILIRKAGRLSRIGQELKVLAQMPVGENRSRKMFVQRILYWLVYPKYHSKNIWLTFDKLYKGGDCGEYFYKYMVSRKDTDVVPAYVIKEKAPDRKRLEQEGYKPLIYGTQEQKLHWLYANMVFATHSSVHGFNGFNVWEVHYIQDRLRAVNTCIQHGLSVQDLTYDSNRIVNNNKRYYCASRHEVENLSRPAYDYDPDVLRLTGIPRYDGLINQDKKQILITPTWRAYIAMPAVMGESRPYNPDFKNTDYYRIFQSLLENKKLSDMAAKTGYKIVYLLHPVISSQKEDFRPPNDIEIVSAVDVNYEKILTESSLMVTDYSGVQFDFAYMRKPVVYFHPPKLPPHYEEGGFFYDTQGFGEICKEIDELVDVLCGYMESGCQLKEFYRARQDDFFAFEDLESCRRIYEDALEYQRAEK